MHVSTVFETYADLDNYDGLQRGVPIASVVGKR